MLCRLLYLYQLPLPKIPRRRHLLLLPASAAFTNLTIILAISGVPTYVFGRNAFQMQCQGASKSVREASYRRTKCGVSIRIFRNAQLHNIFAFVIHLARFLAICGVPTYLSGRNELKRHRRGASGSIRGAFCMWREYKTL